MKRALIFLFLLAIIPCVSQQSALAVPSSEVVVSSTRIALDEIAVVEIKLEWKQSEGNYRFLDPTWKLQNLEYINSKTSNETFVKSSIPWNRVTMKYEFNCQKMGPASITHFKLRYVNLLTQTPGSITIARSIDFEVQKAKKSGKILFYMIALFTLILAGGTFLSIIYTRFSSQQAARREKQRSQLEFEKIPTLIQNPIAKLNKDIVYEWGRRFQAFLIYQYKLPQTLTAEKEVIDRLKNTPLAQADLPEIQRLLREIDRLKYSSDELANADLRQLQKHLLTFIESKKVIGAT